MARIYPFGAIRYNPSRLRLEDVVTQPYDKITPSMQQAYYERSPYNLVRIILGLPELFDDHPDPANGHSALYARAARDFAAWRNEGILYREKELCLFAYSQRFTLPGTGGKQVERRAFIALGELTEYSHGIVFPHEQTLLGPKVDRMQLLRTTRAQFESIFMLYSDPAQTAERVLFANAAKPEIEVTDEFGVTHGISRVSDPSTINIVCAAMEDKKLIIADGHHRYETALEYSREHDRTVPASSERKSYTLPQPSSPEAATMMTFVNMETEGLAILPTHRVVFGLDGYNDAAFVQKINALFDIEPMETTADEVLLARLAEAGRERTSFIAITRDGSYLLREKALNAAEAADGRSNRRQLDVGRLHSIVLEGVLGLTESAIRQQRHLEYVREAAEAREQVSSGRANLAFLVNPVTLDQVRERAFAGQLLPQKSTDFYPKLLSGLAIYGMD